MSNDMPDHIHLCVCKILPRANRWSCWQHCRGENKAVSFKYDLSCNIVMSSVPKKVFIVSPKIKKRCKSDPTTIKCL